MLDQGRALSSAVAGFKEVKDGVGAQGREIPESDRG